MCIRDSKWRVRHPEKIRDKNKKHYIANKEKINAKRKIRRQNADHVAATSNTNDPDREPPRSTRRCDPSADTTSETRVDPVIRGTDPVASASFNMGAGLVYPPPGDGGMKQYSPMVGANNGVVRTRDIDTCAPATATVARVFNEFKKQVHELISTLRPVYRRAETTPEQHIGCR